MRQCFVYVFGPLSGPYKIGHSYDVVRRGCELRAVGSPALPLSAAKHSTMWHLEAFPDRTEAKIVEKAAHQHLGKHRLGDPIYWRHKPRLEWFDVNIVGVSVQPYFVRCTWLNRLGDLREAEFDIALIQHYIPEELKAMLRAVEVEVN